MDTIPSNIKVTIEGALLEAIERAQRFDGTSLALPEVVARRKAALAWVQNVQVGEPLSLPADHHPVGTEES
ncbi:MAG: hypothetical protein IT328_22970 [Caldilineaceae bacterium]|nr:hypothetical protein [Caldilineaceae bacterium]